MAKMCEKCGKKPQTGNKVCHSNIKTKRTFKPNIQTIRIVENGKPRKMKVCASCLTKVKMNLQG